MPLKSGALTPQERKVAGVYAVTGDQGYTAYKAAISQPGASKALSRPAVQAEIARLQVERLFTEALPAAVSCLVSLIKNEKAPAGARVQAAKVVMDRTLGAGDAAHGKEPHEMSGEELARAINELTRVAADRAKVVTIDETPVEASVFD
jgi:hypothetical protein